jgi:predicted GIY-YIG superfamily endonuclease
VSTVWYVYQLTDLSTSEVLWIGQTVDPEHRLVAHRTGNGNSARARLVAAGDDLDMQILCVVQTYEEARRVEHELIVRHLAKGTPLLNIELGGGMNKETARKIGLATARTKQEQIARMTPDQYSTYRQRNAENAAKGGPRTQEARFRATIFGRIMRKLEERDNASSE